MQHLTPRQERFCQSFVYCLNAAKAARHAGYAPRTAKRQGYRLLNDPRIARRIQTIQWTLAEDHGRDTDCLVGKLEMVYRRAMEDRRYHAAAYAVSLQQRIGNPGATAANLWGREALVFVRRHAEANKERAAAATQCAAAEEYAVAAREFAAAMKKRAPGAPQPWPAAAPETPDADAPSRSPTVRGQPGLRAVGT